MINNFFNFNIFGVQVALSFISYFLLAKYYIWPRVMNMGRGGLRALVATNMFRHLGLVFLLSPLVVGSNVPHLWTSSVAIGDMCAVILAIISFVGLSKGTTWARSATWLFNLVGFVDLLIAYAVGMYIQAWSLDIGACWFIATFLTPAFIIIHIMIFKLLAKTPQS